MATFLYAWEIGGGLGHVMGGLRILKALRARGHRVVAALRYLEAGEAMRDCGIETHQAPYLQTRTNDLSFKDAILTPETYAEDFLGRGYFYAADLIGLMQGWVELCKLTRADFAIADFAPTALLAASTLDLPAANVGTGFASPPRVSPIPTTLPWAEVDPERLRRSEERALCSINAALAAFGRPALNAVGEIYRDAADIVTTWPELDHYPERPLERYWGPVLSEASGATPDWPAGDGPRVFVYLNRDFVAFDALATALRASGCRTLVYAGSRPPDSLRAHVGPHLILKYQQMDMTHVLSQCDFVVCHAGHGTVCQALAHGKPLLTLPNHYEQALTARRVEALGAGIRLGRKQVSRCAEAIDDLCQMPSLAAAARVFAIKYAGASQSDVVNAIVDRLEQLSALDESVQSVSFDRVGATHDLRPTAIQTGRTVEQGGARA